MPPFWPSTPHFFLGHISHTVRQRWSLRTKDLAVDETTRRHDCCCPSKRLYRRSDSFAIRASLVETAFGLEVPAAFPWRRRHARHCLPALLRVLSWVPWASVPHASGQESPPAPRYCALLRLPSSIPVGVLLAPFRYLELTHCLCPSQLAPGSARLLAASATKRQGLDYAGHPQSGGCSQGDGRLSRVPGLPFCPHAPLSDPGGVPLACLGAGRTAAFRTLHLVGFGASCPALSFVHHYTFFGIRLRGLCSRLPSASDTASRRSHFGSAADLVASLRSGGT